MPLLSRMIGADRTNIPSGGAGVEQASSATIRSIPAKRGMIIEISGQITDGDADVFKLATSIREGKISTAVESLRIHSKGLERQYDV